MEHPSRIACQVQQQLVLLAAQLQALACEAHCVGGRFDRQRADLERSYRLVVAGCPSQ